MPALRHLRWSVLQASYRRARAFLLSARGGAYARYLAVRLSLWRSVLAVPMPPVPGWKERIATAVAGDGMYIEHPSPGRPGCVGAAPEWSLARVSADGERWEGYDTVSALSGRPITSHPFTGVRCARCGLALHLDESGMRASLDVPGCVPCRRYIRAALRGD